MRLTHITDVTAQVGAPVFLGPVQGGMRAIVPIAGGTFDGPRLKGEVVPMGADWALLQPDGSAFVDAKYLLKMQDGVHVGIRNRGFCRPVFAALWMAARRCFQANPNPNSKRP